ncbi:MAG TPA: fluoride efflux transporter CrcB [Polyangiaceae bacterium]
MLSDSLERLLWVCLAGAAGSGARYLVTLWAGERFGPAFPYGTLIVNLAGCFLIAVVLELASRGSLSPQLRLALATGFIGGLTTYSSFNHETMKLARDGAFGAALLYFAATTFGCFAAGFSGLLLGRRLAE